MTTTDLKWNNIANKEENTLRSVLLNPQSMIAGRAQIHQMFIFHKNDVI